MKAIPLVALGTLLFIAGCSNTPVQAPQSRAVPAATVDPVRPVAPPFLASVPTVPPVASAAAPVVPRLAPTPAVPIPEVTTEVYKRNVARQIYRANSDQLFEGPLPPLLKAVIVLNVHVDSRGQPVRITVMRSNGMRTLEAIATQSVRNAAPLPAPGRLLQRGYAEIVETWLFRADNRFQVRSLAERQLNE